MSMRICRSIDRGSYGSGCGRISRIRVDLTMSPKIGLSNARLARGGAAMIKTSTTLGFSLYSIDRFITISLFS